VTTTFRETMAGTATLPEGTRPFRMDLTVTSPGLWGDVTASFTGRVTIDGIADSATTGTIRIAPLRARIIHYRCEFTTLDGRKLSLDGHKSIDFRHPVRSMTTLPATIHDGTRQIGQAELLFDTRHDLLPFLGSFRWDTPLMEPRWRGQAGRLEVWYTTFTDPETGTGVWIHHETVSPTDGRPPRNDCWAAVFPPGKPPVHGRGTYTALNRMQGSAGDVHWDLTETSTGEPLYTFPKWAWEREILPAAQIVPYPTATFNGTVKWPDGSLKVHNGRGASARIYGHGNAEKWAWLHADLGDGDVLEVVSAVSRRWPLRDLPPLTFLKLRVNGHEWPANTLLAAPRFKATIGLPDWHIEGPGIRVDVHQPPDETLALEYRDPDNATAVCRNTERADVRITLSNGRTWEVKAHAEVGSRE
jgi:hypothetical protein